MFNCFVPLCANFKGKSVVTNLHGKATANDGGRRSICAFIKTHVLACLPVM
jgi:hypothetical protein